MKVGYVLKRYPRYSETFIVNELLAHEREGLELELFSLRYPEDGLFQDIISRVRTPVTYLADRPKAYQFWQALEEASLVLPGFWAELEAARSVDSREVYQAVLLAREARTRHITHLHAHFGTSATTVARLAARLAGIPYTFTAHAKDIFHEDVVPDDLSRKLSDAASVVTVSDYNLDFLREHYGDAANGVRRIYNGLELDNFPYEKPDDRPPRIVGAGRPVEKKGFSDLVDACALLAAGGRDFVCDIVGAGPLEDELMARIARLGLTGRVRLAGAVPQGEVIEYLRDASVFALPCVTAADGNRDGLPTVLLEAMALGAPCVSTAVTGIPEVLMDGKTGLMAGERDPEGLAGALGGLLDDPALRVRLAAEARRMIEEEFDIDANAARLRSVFGVEQHAETGALRELG